MTIKVWQLILLLIPLIIIGFSLAAFFVGLILNQWIPQAWGLQVVKPLSFWQCGLIGCLFMTRINAPHR